MPSPGRRRARYDCCMSAVVAPSPAGGENPQAALCPARRLTFRLGHAALTVEVNDTAALQVLERVYAPMRCDAPRSHPQNAAIRRLADGRLHVRFGRRSLSLAQAPEPAAERIAYTASREIFARFAASIGGTVAFYGAAIGVNGAGVMIVGPASIGKTLLSLHMAQMGATFLGDETAMLTLRGGELFAMARRPSLRESALPWLPSQPMRDAVLASPHVLQNENGRFWYALDERDLKGIAPCERALPLQLVCIVRERRDVCVTRRIDLQTALPLIAQRAYARPAELNQLAALRKALRDVQCLEITLGTPEESASALLREVSGCV